MEIVVSRGAGLDVHQGSVVACVSVLEVDSRRPKRETRTFGTFRRDLVALREWLASLGVTHVAMESTGVYWKPVYEALELGFDITLANARHVRNVPGRKTDVKDAEWLASLLQHGLLRKSFVPPEPIRELRELTRFRRTLIETRSAERNRVTKLLESWGIKLASVATDIFGKSGRRILTALSEGDANAAHMAALALGKLRLKSAALEDALDVPLAEHRRKLLSLQLRRVDELDRDVTDIEKRIAERLVVHTEKLERLTEIPGISTTTASVLLAEVGPSVDAFASAGHLSSWAGLCPGSHMSAGKRSSGRITPGNHALKTALVDAALAASRTKGSFLGEKFRRLAARRGFKRAAIAIAHKMLVIAYEMLRSGQRYVDLGVAYLDRLHEARTVNTSVKKLEQLGYAVLLTKAEGSATPT